jgi:Protein of unknown function/AsmA-like C-terminal region
MPPWENLGKTSRPASAPIAGNSSAPPRGPKERFPRNLLPWNARLLLRQYIKAHHISNAALVLAAAGAAIVFFVVGAAIRLLVGPVSLGPFGGSLSNAIAQALPGITVQYDQAAIEWTRDQGRVNLVILGARVFDSEGRIIAQAPKADIDLAAQPLLQGKAVVRRITLVGVQLTLVRTQDGGLRLGVEKDKNQHDILSRIKDAISKSSGKPSSLQSFAVRDARLAFYDEPTGLFLVAPDANFQVTNEDAGISAQLDASLEIAGHPAHVTGQFKLPPNKGPVTGNVSVTGLDLRALGTGSKAFADARKIGLVVDMSGAFTVLGAHLVSADFGLGAKGTLDVPGLARGPLKVNSLQLVARYDGNTGRLLVDDASLSAGGVAAHLTGRGELFYDASGALERIGFDAAMDKVALDMPGVLASPVALRSVAANGSYMPATRDLVFEHLQAQGGALSLQAQGKLTLVPKQAPALELKGQMGTLPLKEFLHYWPLVAGSGARDWVQRNMAVGNVGPIAFEAHMPAGMLDASQLPEGALKVVLPLSGAEANYIQGLTHLTQLKGVATLTGDTFSADIQSARIGPLAVSKGHALIANLHVPGPPGAFEAHVDGNITDVLTLIDKQPLNYPTRFGIDIQDTKGTAGLDLSFRLPMKKNLSVDDVAIGIKAQVAGLGYSLSDHARLADGSASLEIDNAKLHANGNALLADSRLNFDWTEDFRTNDPVTTRIAIKGTLDDGGRAALNFPSSGFVKGPAPVTATLTGHRASLRSADMTLDLTPAVMTLDLIGLDKPAGFPATAHVTANFGPGSAIQAETLKVTGPGVTASGGAAFDKDGHLVSLAFPIIHFGAANDFSLTLTRANGINDIVVRGKSLDGERLAGRGSKNGDDFSLTGPFHIGAHLDRMMLRDGVAVAPFALDVTGTGDKLATLSLSGSLSKTATISGDLVGGEGGRRLTFVTNDAGLLAKGFFGFSSLKGGKVELAATLGGKSTKADAPDYQGKLVVTDVKVLNQPFLTRLFSAGSLGGLIDLMQNQGISVDKLEVPFSSRNGVIDVHNAHATGPAVGATADGYIDRPKNDIALKGTLVPLFGVNSMLGKIPIIGNVLVSKEGEGIFGMTYSVKGNADQPSVSVNPLSVLTPGIFRRIFEGKMPTAAQAPSNAPGNAPGNTATPPAAPPPGPKPE